MCEYGAAPKTSVGFGLPFRSPRVSKRKFPEQLIKGHHQWDNIKDVLTNPLKIFA